MAHGPDWSDSEDSLFGDDGDYENFKTKTKAFNTGFTIEPSMLTEEQKRQQDLNLFFNALSAGNIETVTQFLEKGMDVNLNIRDGWTPILLAASYCNPDLTKILIENGADVNQDRDKVTALMMACNCPEETSPFETSFKVIKLLVEKGANVQAINRKRMDALMYAACIGNLPAIKYLIEKSNRQAVDNQRWSALTWAVSNNQVEVVKYLISEGFDINLIDVRSNTPLDIAKDHQFDNIVDLFPKEKDDLLTGIVEINKLEFENNFIGLKKGQKPDFYGDVCAILVGVKCTHLIPLFIDHKIGLSRFLSMDENDLREVGVLLPYQRSRILTGLHRFHKRPYHPKSLHVCIKSGSYSNIDVATQVMSAIQQILAMEASLKFILKALKKEELTKEEREIATRNIRNIKLKIASYKTVVRRLEPIVNTWDKMVEPADLITKSSFKNIIPWKKITCCISILGLLLVCRIRK